VQATKLMKELEEAQAATEKSDEVCGSLCCALLIRALVRLYLKTLSSCDVPLRAA
jgi:hypothetical protein